MSVSDLDPDVGGNHHYTEPTPRGLYLMGLYDGLWRFNGVIEGELDLIDAPEELLECLNSARNGEWEFPEEMVAKGWKEISNDQCPVILDNGDVCGEDWPCSEHAE